MNDSAKEGKMYAPAITFHCGKCGELFTEHGSSWQIAWRFLFGPKSFHLCQREQ